MFYMSLYISSYLGTKFCPKLRVHPAPGVHIFTARCTILGGVHPVCARFLSHLSLLYNWESTCSNFPVYSFRRSAPCECTKLNFGHCVSYVVIDQFVFGHVHVMFYMSL